MIGRTQNERFIEIWLSFVAKACGVRPLLLVPIMLSSI